jgi:hypothetical protein
MSINDVENEINKNINMNKDELYNMLIEIYPKPNVELAMFKLFVYEYKKTEEKEKRLDQQSFRDDLIKRYKGCIITGVSEYVCEACHIIPHSECNDKDKYNVDNGLLLRRDLHSLFDKGLLKINPNTNKLLLDDKILNDNNMKEYYQYNNKKINIHINSIKFLNQIY